MQETAENQLAVSLGNGWYKGKFGLNSQSNNFGDTFKLIAELRLIYEDGEIQVIGTDETWNYIGSDVEDDGIYDGEIINHLLWEEKENPAKQAVLTEAEGNCFQIQPSCNGNGRYAGKRSDPYTGRGNSPGFRTEFCRICDLLESSPKRKQTYI